MLPMGMDRIGLYRHGVLLAGDAAGLVNPFNGEGVSYALESGAWAGRAVGRAHDAGFGTPAAEKALQGYHHQVKAAFGHYMGAGRLFAALMGHEAVLAACVRFGLPRPALMRLVNKLMANLVAPDAGSLDDRVIRAALRLVPSA
jgi:flavin-dependent dehydrogenase